MGAFEKTKAIMSPPNVTGWKQLVFTWRWHHKLELSQEVMDTHLLQHRKGDLFVKMEVRVIELGKGPKSYNVKPWTMILTLNWPWSNKRTAHQLIILDTCAELFENPTRGSKDIEGTRKTVIQCSTLNYDLDYKPTLVKHTHCTWTHHTWHLFKVI